MKQKRIIFSNQKGGVGKSTLSRELGLFLGHKGFKVLLIDCDPQGNLSKGLLEDAKEEGGLYEALNDGAVDILKVNENVSVLAGDIRLALLERQLLGELDAYSKVSTLLEKEEFQNYDYILFDTPPSLGVLTVNAMTAADYIVIPMKTSQYSMQGTNDLMDTISKVRRSLNHDLKLLGVIINVYEDVPVITRQIKDEIVNAFGLTCFAQIISKTIKIEEAIALRKGVVEVNRYDWKRVKVEVESLGAEFLNRLGAEA